MQSYIGQRISHVCSSVIFGAIRGQENFLRMSTILRKIGVIIRLVVSAGSSSMGRAVSQTPPTEHQQQHSVEQLHNYSFSPTLTLSPSLDRQLSTELTEYLSSQEQSIDGCRDLIGGHWDLNLNLDSCLDDEPRQQQLMLQGVDPTLAMSEEPTTPDLLTPNVSPQRNIGSDE